MQERPVDAATPILTRQTRGVAAPAAPAEPISAPARRRRSPTIARRLLGSRQATAGGLLLALMLLAAVLAPWLAPYDPLAQQLSRRLEPPVFFGGSAVYPLGSDPNGRDILSRLLFGAQISLSVGFLSMLLAGTVGVVVPVGRREEVDGWLGPRDSERIPVLEALDTKGLEFDGIVVVEPDAIVAESEAGIRTLYVVLTRATQQLDVIGTTDAWRP